MVSYLIYRALLKKKPKPNFMGEVAWLVLYIWCVYSRWMSFERLGNQKLNARHLYCITKKADCWVFMLHTLLSLVLTVVGFCRCSSSRWGSSLYSCLSESFYHEWVLNFDKCFLQYWFLWSCSFSSLAYWYDGLFWLIFNWASLAFLG